MPVYGDPPISWWTSDNTTYSYPAYTTTGTYEVINPQPFVAVPVTPVPPPVDDSPLVWLREQVSEVCEFARAA